MGALVLGFWIVGAVVIAIALPRLFWEIHLSAWKVLHLVTGIGLLVVWRLCLGPLRARWVLSAFDVVGALETMTIASLIVALSPGSLRSEFIGLAPLTLFVWRGAWAPRSAPSRSRRSSTASARR